MTFLSFFCNKNDKIWTFLCKSLEKHLILLRNVKQCYNFYFLQYTHLITCFRTPTHLYTTKTTFSKVAKCVFFTPYWLHKGCGCWPKGQQVLTKISDLEKHRLSSLWLFLWLPEPIWSLRNHLYTKTSPKNQ